MHRLHGLRVLKLQCVLFSLWAALTACQTTAPKPQPKADQILAEQKALVRTALDSGRPDASLQSLRDLLQEHPEDAELQNLMGLTQLALKNNMRAVKHFQIAYKLDHRVATGLNLSSAMIEAGEHARATKLLTALLKQAETEKYRFKERIYHNLGYCYFKQNRMAKAETWFQEAIEENPTFFPSHLEIARLYERTKRPAMALKAYRRSRDYCALCFEPVEALTSIYQRLGKTADARKLLVDFAKTEGVAVEDRVRANDLLNQITTASLPQTRRGG